jgi:hypothetical protein
MKSLTIVAALLALAGCASVAPSRGTGLDEVVMKNVAGTFAPPARDYQRIVARSFQPDEEGGWVEVRGATCRVGGGPYQAAFTAPAVVVMPDLGPDAPALTADCALGTLNGRDVVAPSYPWPEEARPDMARRIAYGGGWWFGFEKSGPLTYRDIAVGMRPTR